MTCCWDPRKLMPHKEEKEEKHQIFNKILRDVKKIQNVIQFSGAFFKWLKYSCTHCSFSFYSSVYCRWPFL